jgi:hypothetical protein
MLPALFRSLSFTDVQNDSASVKCSAFQVVEASEIGEDGKPLTIFPHMN